MKLLIKRCHTCGALGVGPKAVKLWPFEGRMFCKAHYQDPLTWHESRGAVTSGIRSEQEFYEAVRGLREYKKVVRRIEWGPYIQDLCGLAEFGLMHQDQKIFVRYFSRAVWAWALSQEV